MQRAAAGLATPVLDLLGGGVRPAGAAAGRPGDNGGDALYAGALLARRGRRGRGAWLLADTVARGRAGRAARAPAAGSSTLGPATRARRGRRRHRRDRRRPGLRRRRGGRARARCRGVPVVAVDVPSGVDVDTGELDGAARDAPTSPSPSAPTRSRHLVDPAASALRRRAPRRHRPRPARGRRSRRSRPTTSPRCCRGPAPTRRSTPAAWSASAPARRAYPGAGAALRRRAPRPGWPAWSGTSAAARRRRSARAHPEVVVGEGQVQAWVVGSGGGDGRGDALADGPGRRRAGGRRRRRAGRTSTGPLDVPGGAHPARRRAGRDARRRARPRSRPRQLRARPRARPREYDAVVLLKGRHTLVAAPGRPGPGHHHRRRRGWPPPAPATCSPG